MAYYVDDDDHWEEYTYFTECTCVHDPSDHGWMHCDKPNCPCEGHWEE